MALLFAFQAVYVLRLLGTSDLVTWLVLGLTSASLAIVLLDDALDLEGKIAEQAARDAIYDPDQRGARREAVLDHVDISLRRLGRIPSVRAYLRQPDTHELFRVYFPSRRAQCKRWLANALLGCLHSALRLVAFSLLLMVSVQLWFLTAA